MHFPLPLLGLFFLIIYTRTYLQPTLSGNFFAIKIIFCRYFLLVYVDVEVGDWW